MSNVPPKDRYELANICNSMGLLGVAVEVGTDKGLFARRFLEMWHGRLLVCIDPWLPYVDKPWSRESDYLMTIHNLSPFFAEGRVEIIKERNGPAIADFIVRAFGLVDFVYVDGDHDRSAVRVDVDSWYSRISPGGIVSGHDYLPAFYPGLVTEVDDLCSKNCLSLKVLEDSSWYTEKPQ